MRILDRAESSELGLVERLYPEVIAPSFPSEQVGRPWEGADIPADLLLVAWEEGSGEVLGCVTAEILPRSDTLLVGYLATRPGARGRGIGSALMREVQDRWLTGETLALTELDDPRHHEPDPRHGDPWARLRFYERFGVRVLAAPYFQPSLGEGYGRSYHLLLCRLSARGESAPSAAAGARVRLFLREYFTVCEGEQSLEDPEVRWLLDQYGEELELVSPSGLALVPDAEPPRSG